LSKTKQHSFKTKANQKSSIISLIITCGSTAKYEP